MKLSIVTLKELEKWQIGLEKERGKFAAAIARSVESFLGYSDLQFSWGPEPSPEQLTESHRDLILPNQIYGALELAAMALHWEGGTDALVLHLARKEPREPEQWFNKAPAWVFILKGENVHV